LYYGYRVLDARVQARDAALDTWRKIHALYEVNRRGGEAEKEAQARSQYFAFQQDVQNALCGEPIEETRNWNGLPSGTFRSTLGVLMAERRLRLLMGLAPSDGKLIRPKDEPVDAKIDFDWNQVTCEASTRRAELRRQKFQIRRRELELIASKNNLLPRLDAVGRYRWRGFGDDLFPLGPPPAPPNSQFDSAYDNLTSGNFQEWQLGFELNMPLGFREAHVAERNAELLLARERAILRDQQREVIHEAADAVSEMDRAYAVLQTSYNRLAANRDQLGAVSAAYDNDKVPLDLFLDAQRRVADAEIDYHLNRSRYTLAAKNVHFVKGTLLEYDGVFLAEGPWPNKAYQDAAEREARRGQPRPLNYASSLAPIVSQGPFDQRPGEKCVPGSVESVKPGVLPNETLPPPSDVQPIPPASEAAPPKGASTTPEAAPKVSQPEVIQASGAAPPIKLTNRYPVIGAGHNEPLGSGVPKIELRPGSLLESSTGQSTPPPAPLRLPPTNGTAQ